MKQTINLYQMGNDSDTYENPFKETIQHYADRKNDLDSTSKTLKDDVQKYMETYVNRIQNNIPEFFVGTEDEYQAWVITQKWLHKIVPLRTISAPLVDAYIQKCADYITLHIGTIKADNLVSYTNSNGKLDASLIKQAVDNAKGKEQSMIILANVFKDILVLIESAELTDIDKLPTYDPTQLNTFVDELWNKQQAEERKALMTLMGWTQKDMDIIDKYSMTNSDEAYVEPVKEWSRKKAKSLKDMGV